MTPNLAAATGAFLAIALTASSAGAQEVDSIVKKLPTDFEPTGSANAPVACLQRIARAIAGGSMS